MSRTIRTGAIFANCHRKFTNMNYKKNEQDALDELRDFGVTPSNRHQAFNTRIKNAWDDYPVSGANEFHTKNFWRNIRENEPIHFTKNN